MICELDIASSPAFPIAGLRELQDPDFQASLRTLASGETRTAKPGTACNPFNSESADYPQRPARERTDHTVT